MISIRPWAAFVILGVTLAVAGGGCASTDRPASVPLSAQDFGGGKGEATFNVAYQGTVYVVDDNRKELIYTGKVSQGDFVKVDAKGNKVTVNNQPVVERDLLNDHKYKIFFERAMVPAPASAQG